MKLNIVYSTQQNSIPQYYQLPILRILSKMSQNDKDQAVSDSLTLNDFKTWSSVASKISYR